MGRLLDDGTAGNPLAQHNQLVGSHARLGSVDRTGFESHVEEGHHQG